MGLDDIYSSLRTQIINMDPVPSLDRVYALVTQEESHRAVTHAHEEPPTLGFAAQMEHALAATTGNNQTGQSYADRTPSGHPWCTFSQRVGHTYDRCYTRLGVNPTQRTKGKGRGRSAQPSNAQTAPARGQQPAGPVTAAAVAAPRG